MKKIVLIFVFFNITVFSQTVSIDSLSVLFSVKKDLTNFIGQVSGIQAAPNIDGLYSYYRQDGEYKQLWLYNHNEKQHKQIQTSEAFVSDDDLSFLQPRSNKKLYEAELSWCPVLLDGKQYFVFVGAGSNANFDIYIGAEGEKDLIRLTNNTEIDYMPRWSPDGKRIVFVSSRSGKGDIYLIDNVKIIINEYNLQKFQGVDKSKNIYEVIIDGKLAEETTNNKTSLIRLTDNPFEDLYPEYSPNGKYIAYTANQPDHDVLNYGISIIDLSDLTKKPYRLTTEFDKSESRAVWTSDGENLIFYKSKSIDDDKVEIHLSRFGDESLNQIISDATIVEDYRGPVTSYGEAGESVVYRYYNKETNQYEVRICLIHKNFAVEPLYKQEAYIRDVSSHNQFYYLSLQDGADYKIVFNKSDLLGVGKKSHEIWGDQISRNHNFFRFLSFISKDKTIQTVAGIAGSAGVFGALLSIIGLGGENGPPTEASKTFGLPPFPSKINKEKNK
jgi:hypothetical protein